MNNKNLRKYLKPLSVIGIVLIFIGLYWYGAVKQLTLVNTDMQLIDQSAYMEYARNLSTSNYTFIGGRNRMPIYPFLQSLFYRPGISDEDFFLQGKYLNLALSLFLLAGLMIIFRRFFLWIQVMNLILIVAFNVFIFRAGYFQVEILFYFLSFCLFLLMWEFLCQMSWKLGVLTGIVAGIAHLTKASILPGLIIFIVLAGIKWVRAILRGRRSSDRYIRTTSIFSDLRAIVLIILFFLITIFPYINNSKRIFGRYFYNVNSTFYIWYDSWDEAMQGTRAYGDRVGWPKMPPNEIPSMENYFREHTSQQILNRIVSGGQKVFNNIVGSYGYFKYIVVYLGVLIIAILRYWRQAYHHAVSNPIIVLFLMLYFFTYAMLYFWYASIASGNRLILALFLPCMFTVSYGLKKLLSSKQINIRAKVVNSLTFINLLILPFVITDIYFVVTERVETVFGGG